MQQPSSLDALSADSGKAELSRAHYDGEHPVIDMPFSAIVDGRLFEGDGISLVGARAHGLVPPQLEGERRLVTLLFAFSGFNVALPTEALIETASVASGSLSLRFTKPTGPHLPQLRHLLNSFIAGDINDVRSVLSVSAGPADSKPMAKSSPSRSAAKVLGGLARGLLITAASLALFGYVGSKIYERVFVVHADGISLISKDGTVLRSVSSGQLDFVDPTAAKGQVAYSVRATSGELVSVSMPCDCETLPGSLTAGATVLAGDTVMNVAPVDAQAEVKVRIALNGYRALSQGALAELALSDGTVVQAGLKAAALPTTSSDAQDTLDVVLSPLGTLDPSLIGTPVSVTVETAPFAPAVDYLRGLVLKGFNQ
ncbi:alginate biosynthesis protein Alg44 [Devosia sp. UYZn731]|uniref:pilus assembly protein PilZ n=1 Tax=Devosia sp. UYZn731 TaxID=3156345 RepID=UPI00339B831A